MTRLRYNGLVTTLAASLTSSATAVTFGAALTHSGGTGVPTIGAGDSIPLSILDSTGKLSEVVYLTAYTSSATTGTITRGQEGTTGVSHASGDKVVHGPLVTDINSAGSILAFKELTTSAAYATTTTTDADLDTTTPANCEITFTVPASGNVMIRQEAYCGWGPQGSGGFEWTVRDTSGTVVKTASMSNSIFGNLRRVASHVVTGLTPGASVTYRWGHHRTTASTGTATVFTGGNGGANGNAQVTVFSMP